MPTRRQAQPRSTPHACPWRSRGCRHHAAAQAPPPHTHTHTRKPGLLFLLLLQSQLACSLRWLVAPGHPRPACAPPGHPAAAPCPLPSSAGARWGLTTCRPPAAPQCTTAPGPRPTAHSRPAAPHARRPQKHSLRPARLRPVPAPDPGGCPLPWLAFRQGFTGEQEQSECADEPAGGVGGRRDQGRQAGGQAGRQGKANVHRP
jgi:hypothetical protein